MRLKRYQYCFSRSHTAGAGQAVGQGDLSRRMILDGSLVLGRNFIGVLNTGYPRVHNQEMMQLPRSLLAFAVAEFPLV